MNEAKNSSRAPIGVTRLKRRDEKDTEWKKEDYAGGKPLIGMPNYRCPRTNIKFPGSGTRVSRHSISTANILARQQTLPGIRILRHGDSVPRDAIKGEQSETSDSITFKHQRNRSSVNLERARPYFYADSLAPASFLRRR